MGSDAKIRKYLLSQIEVEGYPLEIEISEILDREKQWIVENSAYFFDYELNKGRTIDIQAWHNPDVKIPGQMLPFFAVCELPIECKKSGSHAWIFFTRPHTSFGHYLGQRLDFVQIKTEMKNFSSRLFLNVREKPSLHYAEYKRVAISYAELLFDKSKRKSKSPPSLILKAINQLMKFITYENRRIKDTNLEGWSSMPFYFYFPVVVFEGKMYEYYEESGKKTLTPVDRVLLESSYRPSYHYRDVDFAIEIITKDVLGKLLKDVRKDCSTIYSGIIGAKEELMGEYSKFLPHDVLRKALLDSAKSRNTQRRPVTKKRA